MKNLCIKNCVDFFWPKCPFERMSLKMKSGEPKCPRGSGLRGSRVQGPKMLTGRRRTYRTILKLADHALSKMVRLVLL
jgi:hypothetical protein